MSRDDESRDVDMEGNSDDVDGVVAEWLGVLSRCVLPSLSVGGMQADSLGANPGLNSEVWGVLSELPFVHRYEKDKKGNC